jgi:hypothetical protein
MLADSHPTLRVEVLVRAQNQVIQTDFVHDAPKNEDTLRLTLTNQVSGLKTFCSDRTGNSDDPFRVVPQDRNDLHIHIKEAIKTFDSLAQEFSKTQALLLLISLCIFGL